MRAIDTSVEKKLLLVGIPRGITSFVYQQVCRVTSFTPPHYVTDGEILNPERFDPTSVPNDSYLHDVYAQLRNIPFYTKSLKFIKQISNVMDAVPDGFVVKDVVNPWLLNEYLAKSNHGYFVIYLRRPLEQIQFALDRRGWDVYRNIQEVDNMFLSYPTINVNSSLFDSEYISLKLESFGICAKRFNYLDHEFSSRTEQFFRDFYSNSAGSPDDIGESRLTLAKWAYRYILGREPESEEVVRVLAREGTLAKMRIAMLRSKEFNMLFKDISRQEPETTTGSGAK